MFSRVGFFFLTNLMVILTVSIAVEILGIGKYLATTTGLDHKNLLIFCSLWGFSGSTISLLFSRIVAKRIYQIEVIDPQTEIPELKGIVSINNELSKKAGIKVPPQIGIYDSEEINAFATGPTKNRALIAISTKMLSTMSIEQVIAVIGHEMGHIANGDMVTMTLVQGTVNSFSMFFSRVISFAILNNVRQDLRRVLSYFLTITFDVLFTAIGSIFVAWFSRRREYRADLSSSELYSPVHMIDALQFLKLYEGRNNQNKSLGLNSLKIDNGEKKKFLSFLFSSHPPLEKRIIEIKKKYRIV